jgi:hypothetical protein
MGAGAVAAVFGVVSACGSSGDGGSPSSTPSSGSDASNGSPPPTGGGDGAALPDGAPGDAGSSVDAGDAGSNPYGDRNLGVREPYPDSVLIQNGGRFYNLQKPPTAELTAAKGDGKTDDTAAWLDAFDYLKALYVASNPTGAAVSSYDAENIWIYVPDGTYLVSSTLSYRGDVVTGSDIVRVRIVGESREGTVIRLADATPAFGDAAKPATVLEFQHDGTTFNNEASDNVLTNLTIDTGKGNPGANALWFQGANSTSMHNVLLESEDGQGHCGLDFQSGSLQGYYRDLTVQGFDYGICQLVNPEIDSALEHVTLRQQNKAGVYVLGGGMSARLFDVDESTTSAEGVRIDKDGAVVLVDESSFRGSASVPALELTAATEQALFLRNIVTVGFQTSLVRAGADAQLGATVAFYDSYAPFSLLGAGAGADAGLASLGLPVEDTPLASWGDPATDWASVDDYAADGEADDTAAAQKALDSGKPVVVFPRGTYKLTAALHVPATVQRIDFMFTDADANLTIDGPSALPLRLSHHLGYSSATLTAVRPVVLDHWSGGFNDSVAATTPTKVYVENAANTGAGPTFVASGETMWARSVNDEQGAGGNPDILVNGGTLWLFGYKTENKAVTSVSVNQGARVEVLNGYVNMTEAPGSTPMLVNHDSTFSYFGFTNLGAAIHGPFTTILTESQDGGGAATLTYDAGFGGVLPARGGGYKADFVVPLYVGAPR